MSTRFDPIAVLFLCGAVLFQSGEVLGATRGCIPDALAKAIGRRGGFSMDLDPAEYKDADRILLLSDGTPDAPERTLGAGLHKAYPEKLIVSADIQTRGIQPSENGGLVWVHMDNTRPFPFEKDSFDRIVMRNGMCVCFDGRACGGFCPTNYQVERFFTQVVLVLNKKNPKARAYLHGQNGVTRDISAHWERVAREIEKRHDVEFVFHYDRVADQLNSITIRPKQ